MTGTASSPRPARGLLDRIVAPFDSVWLGICLMAILFVYCSVGSAGIFRYIGDGLLGLFQSENWIHVQLRTDRGLEMTEYEWFHWWPFKLLIGLICVNLVVVTLRRIRLNAINAGVWMIHAGIIVLALGCVWYYSTKVEGDAPVVRGELAITLPSGETASLPTVPGAQQRVRARDGVWDLRVWSTEPQWSLASAGDEGKSAYSVMLEVQSPERRFLRQVLAGYPEYTEDMVFTDDRAQPMKRAVKVTGEALVQPDLKVELRAPEARWFYLAHWIEKSWALYVRERTPDNRNEWIQRPVEGLPLYNDYITHHDDIWMPDGREIPVDPDFLVNVPSEDPADPLAGTDIRLNAYLRYGKMESRRVEAGHGATFDPVVDVMLDDGTGEKFRYELAALHPEHKTADGGFVSFELIEDADDIDGLIRDVSPALEVRVGDGELVEVPILDFSMRNPAMPWSAIGDTGYELRVEFIENDLQLASDRRHSMASVEVRAPASAEGGPREFRRWVFDDPRLNRDVSARDEAAGDDPHGGGALDLPDGIEEPDPAIDIVYRTGRATTPITVAAMADGELGVALNLVPGADGEWFPVELGEPVSLGRGATVTLTDYSAHAVKQVRPYAVPPEERVRNMQHKQSMVRFSFRHGQRVHEAWVPYHEYPVQRPAENLRRYRYQPASVQLDDGRVLEFVFSRQRYLLPAAVTLDHFELAAHTGGFTGTTQSIRNWTSFVRFENADGSYTEPLAVSVNQPVEHQGLSFFQAQWDPPSGPRFSGDVSSSGLNYTVLGVGNRNGVVIQLIGTCISVLGMLYAFYYKPILLRRRKAQRSAGGGSGSRGSAADAGMRPVAVSAPQDDNR